MGTQANIGKRVEVRISGPPEESVELGGNFAAAMHQNCISKAPSKMI